MMKTVRFGKGALAIASSPHIDGADLIPASTEARQQNDCATVARVIELGLIQINGGPLGVIFDDFGEDSWLVDVRCRP
jgi:hypothetical protein